MGRGAQRDNPLYGKLGHKQDPAQIRRRQQRIEIIKQTKLVRTAAGRDAGVAVDEILANPIYCLEANNYHQTTEAILDHLDGLSFCQLKSEFIISRGEQLRELINDPV